MMCAPPIAGLQNGCRGLAAEPGPREIEAVFRENENDETVLPSLTAEDLKDLGVSIVGHRRKILDAIAALRNDASGRAPSVDVAKASPRGWLSYTRCSGIDPIKSRLPISTPQCRKMA